MQQQHDEHDEHDHDAGEDCEQFDADAAAIVEAVARRGRL